MYLSKLKRKSNKLVNGLCLFSAFSLSACNSVQAQDLSKLPLSDILKQEYVGETPQQSSQYDFFIGEWDIFLTEYDKSGKVKDTAKGVWWAKYIHDKRVVYDDVVLFDGKGKLHAGYPSLRTFSKKLGKWVSMHMAPLATQALCSNVGTWENNEMRIDAVCRKTDGTIQGYSRVRFYNITDNSFDYTWEDSQDQKNWTLYVTFEGKRRIIAQ